MKLFKKFDEPWFRAQQAKNAKSASEIFLKVTQQTSAFIDEKVWTPIRIYQAFFDHDFPHNIHDASSVFNKTVSNPLHSFYGLFGLIFSICAGLAFGIKKVLNKKEITLSDALLQIDKLNENKNSLYIEILKELEIENSIKQQLKEKLLNALREQGIDLDIHAKKNYYLYLLLYKKTEKINDLIFKKLFSSFNIKPDKVIELLNEIRFSHHKIKSDDSHIFSLVLDDYQEKLVGLSNLNLLLKKNKLVDLAYKKLKQLNLDKDYEIQIEKKETKLFKKPYFDFKLVKKGILNAILVDRFDEYKDKKLVFFIEKLLGKFRGTDSHQESMLSLTEQLKKLLFALNIHDSSFEKILFDKYYVLLKEKNINSDQYLVLKLRVQLELIQLAIKQHGEEKVNLISQSVFEIEDENNFCQRFNAFCTLIPAFYDADSKTLNFNETLYQSRARAIKKAQSLKNTGYVKNSWNLASDFSFNFWLAFFPTDVWFDETNTSNWPLSSQAAVLISAAVLSLMSVFIKVYGYLKLQKSIQLDESEAKLAVRKVYDQTTKFSLYGFVHHSLLEETYKTKLKNWEPQKLHPLLQKKIQKILNSQKFGFYNKSEICKQFFVLDELNKKINSRSMKKSFLFDHWVENLNYIFPYGVQLSFIGWVLGTILIAAGALQIAAFILGDPFSLALFFGGMILGFGIALKMHKRHLKSNKLVVENFNEQKEKYLKLIHIDEQNQHIKALMEANHIKPIAMLEPSNPEQMKNFDFHTSESWIGTSLNYLSMAISHTGSGVLIARLTLLPAVAIITHAVLGPPGWAILFAVSLALGIAWASFKYYEYYCQQNKLAALQTLTDLDNRINLAQINQNALVTQLGLEFKPKEVSASEKDCFYPRQNFLNCAQQKKNTFVSLAKSPFGFYHCENLNPKLNKDCIEIPLLDDFDAKFTHGN